VRSQVPVLFLFMPGVVATAENERPGEAWVLAIGGASSSTGGGGVERQRAASLDANRNEGRSPEGAQQDDGAGRLTA
jgi:hypothetical protein